MKQLFLSAIKVFITAILITGTVHAQKVSLPLQPAQDLVSNGGKSFDETGKTPAPEIASTVLKDFKNRFANVTDVRWNDYKKTIVAIFNTGAVQTRVIYLKNGHYLHSLITYDSTNLDAAIHATITRDFKAFHVIWVTEVHENNRVFYFINIENEKKFKQLYVHDDEIVIYKEFDRAN